MNLEHKKNQYWGHFEIYVGSNTKFKKLTRKRLLFAKNGLWKDQKFWFDIFRRHSGMEKTPAEMKEESPETYLHMIGNMVGMVTEYLVQQGKYK